MARNAELGLGVPRKSFWMNADFLSLASFFVQGWWTMGRNADLGLGVPRKSFWMNADFLSLASFFVQALLIT